MIKFIGISGSLIILGLTGCTSLQSDRSYPAVTPNPVVGHYPVIQTTTPKETPANKSNTVATADTDDTTTTTVLNARYPTGVGINVNGYGPSNANFYEAGFFSNF